jgi:hypothetical protein
MRREGDTLDWLAAHPTFYVGLVERTDRDIHHITEDYVERYWLPIIGPSALLAARRLARTAGHDGGLVNLIDLGSSLGIGAGTGRHTTINRTIARLVDFDLAHITADRLDITRWLPDLPSRFRRRLPLCLADELHDLETAS